MHFVYVHTRVFVLNPMYQSLCSMLRIEDEENSMVEACLELLVLTGTDHHGAGLTVANPGVPTQPSGKA